MKLGCALSTPHHPGHPHHQSTQQAAPPRKSALPYRWPDLGQGLALVTRLFDETGGERLLWGSDWVVQDLDSTNGTWHDGERVASPVPVIVGAPIKVGATTFELRK